jgi:ABC-type transport system involved in multi-copper enzyme maturation permease subunit
MTLQKTLMIAFYTFKEIWKSKILLNVFFVGVGLMVVTYVATEFTYGVPERVALDFGLGMLSLSTLGISLFLGVGLLSREIESRTVYMVISRPVPRFSFILGKLIGLMSIQAVNVFILASMTMTATKLLGGKIDGLILWAIGFIFLESLMLLLVVVLLSLMANNILSVLFSIVLLLLGHVIKDTQEISFIKTNPLVTKILDIYHFVLPAFYKLNLKDFILYKNDLPMSYLTGNLAYGIFYSGFLLLLVVFLFNRKNLD